MAAPKVSAPKKLGLKQHTLLVASSPQKSFYEFNSMLTPFPV